MFILSNRGRKAAVAAIALLASPIAAEAQQPLASAGLWSAYAANGQDQRPVCGVGTTGADGRRILVQQTSGDNGIEIILEKTSWAIPDQTIVDVAFQFDNGAIVAERATGSGTRLAVDLPFDRSVTFMRSLRYGSQIQVHFPSGNEGVWTGGLRGSSAMIDAFNECRTRFATTPVTGPTQPFAASATPNPNATSPGATSPGATNAGGPAPGTPATQP